MERRWRELDRVRYIFTFTTNASVWQWHKWPSQLLTEFPHMRSRPHSRPWLSGHEKHCRDHEFPFWMKDPEKTNAFIWFTGRLQRYSVFKVWRNMQARQKRGRTYRHRAFVSSEFIKMFTCCCLPNHDQLVHVSSGLKQCREKVHAVKKHIRFFPKPT